MKKKRSIIITVLILISLILLMFLIINNIADMTWIKEASTNTTDSLSVTSDSTSDINSNLTTKDDSVKETMDTNQLTDSDVSESASQDTAENPKIDNISNPERGSDLANTFDQTSSEPLSRKSLRKLEAGSILELDESAENIMDDCFYYEEIKDDIKARIQGKSYKDDCTVPYEDLRYVRVLYYGFDEKTHIGELIVNKAISSDIVDIFAELYENKYPIERMVLVDEYDADDNASMAANNTSSFNYRTVPGAKHLSKHALGLAIDINPLYNPYIQYNGNETTILPPEGSKYADRTLDCPYYINENDLCYKAFTKRGFTWGGFWKTSPDYQHFQKTIE